MAKSVYNFVPAPEEKDVYKPEWSAHVSHDIPFKDGESGVIDIKITAQTPIFIRNGHTKEDKNTYDEYLKKIKNNPQYQPNEEEINAMDRYLSFSKFNDKYFIPATSLKGVIRNTLEVFSFSRLKTEDDLFAFRKMEDKRYASDVQKSKPGWLYKDKKGNWKIKECWSDNVELGSLKTLYSKNWKELSASEKYKLIKKIDNDYFPAYNVGSYRKVGFQGRVRSYNLSNKGGNRKLVVFGNIQGKKREYLFSNKNNAKIYDVPKGLINNLNKIEEKLDEKDSLWRFFIRNKIEKIPVFFFSDRNKNTNEVKHFGLSKLYKRTDTFSLFELSPVKTYIKLGNKYKKDLTTTMFGEIEEDNYTKNKGALKGRVMFSHALAEGNPTEMGEKEFVLSDPKASYYHFYTKDGKPYTDSNAELAGFKKYLPHLNVKPTNVPKNEDDENEKVITKINPLNKDTEFNAMVRYHNLKKVEIGALISALTFHGKSNRYSHTLGGAKPFGYGKVKIEITSIDEKKIKDYIDAFENEINKHLKEINQVEWEEQIRIQQHFALSIDCISKEEDKLLTYPKLDNGNPDTRKKNDFKNYITNKDMLKKVK